MSTLEAKLLINISNVSTTNTILLYRSVVSSSGDVYITGTYRGTLDIGGGVPTISTISIFGSGFIAKYNSTLTPISLNGMNGTISSHRSTGTSIAISSSGDVYVTGEYKGTLNIGGTVPIINTISTGVDGGSGFIAKYNSALIPISLNGMYGTISTDSSTGYSIAISSSDDIYVTGTYIGTLNIGGGVLSINTISTDGSGFIAKYNSALTPISLNGMDGTTSSDRSIGTSIAISSSGDVYVTGTYIGTLNIGGGVLSINTISTDGSGFIAKYNSALTPISLNGMDGTISSDRSIGYSIAISSSGDVYVTGEYKGTLNIGGTIPIISTISTDSSSFIAKYNSTLTPISLNGMDGTTSSDRSIGYSIAISSSGDVYVTGTYIGTLNIGGGVLSINTISTGVDGGSGFIAKYNSALKPISLNGMNVTTSSDRSIGTSIAISSSGDVYVTGTYIGTLNIGDEVPTITNNSIVNSGFIAKYLITILPPNEFSNVQFAINAPFSIINNETSMNEYKVNLKDRVVFYSGGPLDTISITSVTPGSIVNQIRLPNIYVSQLQYSVKNDLFEITIDGVTYKAIPNSFIIIDNICFHKGTMILTPNGYKAVETLNSGDLVTTVQGRITKIVDVTSFTGKSNRCPLYILHKGTLGTNKPIMDLYMSGGHAYSYNGRWCHMKCSSLTMKLDEEDIEYYNIVLDNYLEHTLVANGVEVESLFKMPGLDMKWDCKEDHCKPIITRNI
jgi:hypothetical protein